MSFFSRLPVELRELIWVLAIPLNTTIAPCVTASQLAIATEKKIVKNGSPLSKIDRDKRQIAFRKMVVSGNNGYVDDKEEAEACTALLLTCGAIHQELGPRFYGSNTFAFPGGHLLQPFICLLSTTKLSYLETISISFSIDWAKTFLSTAQVDTDLLWSQLSCLRRCGNMKEVQISLEAKSCEFQPFLFDSFLLHGRKAIGLAPNVMVAFNYTGTCGNLEKRQHWRWASETGSQEWELTHFIGSTPVQSLSEILAAHPISNDPALKASSVAKIKEVGADLKRNRGCGFCGGYPVGMPDDLRLSRGFWCNYCEVVMFCSVHWHLGTLHRANHCCVLNPRFDPESYNARPRIRKSV